MRAQGPRVPRPPPRPGPTPPRPFPSQFGNRALGDKAGGARRGKRRAASGDAPLGSAGTPRRRPVPPSDPRLPRAPVLRGPSPASPQVLPCPPGPPLARFPSPSSAAAPHRAAGSPGAASSAGPRPVPLAAASCAPRRHRLHPLLFSSSSFAAAAAAAAFASVSSRGRSRSRRRPDPREGACALRAAMGAGASRRGLGAGGARQEVPGWEGAPRDARAAARAPNFPTRSGLRALPGGPGRSRGAARVRPTRVESGAEVDADFSGTIHSPSLIPGTGVPRLQGLTWSRRLTAS